MCSEIPCDDGEMDWVLAPAFRSVYDFMARPGPHEELGAAFRSAERLLRAADHPDAAGALKEAIVEALLPKVLDTLIPLSPHLASLLPNSR